MSREDPQFKLRMPAELREQAELAAKAAGRSLNSELVNRLEASFLSNASPEKLMTASRARELASMARAGLPEEIRKRILIAINHAVGLGHSSVSVDLKDFRLDGGLDDAELDELTGKISNELIESGYSVEWDGAAWIWIKF